MSKAPADFNTWLSELGEVYISLSSAQRIQTLEFLISKSDGSHLYHLTRDLHLLTKRDFIIGLPVEVTEVILQWLDGGSLFSCCQVSKSWQKTINNCTGIWKQACTREGFCVQKCKSVTDYKNTYRTCRKKMKQIEEGTAFEELYLEGHTRRVTVVSYRDGILATGSDDHTVRLWDCNTGECIQSLNVLHTVSSLKFDSSYVFTAFFNCTASCWDIQSGQQIQTFVGNVTAVFSLDYNIEADLFLTGSYDCSLKIWCISSGHLRKTWSHLGDSLTIWQVCLTVRMNAQGMIIYILSLTSRGIQLSMFDKVTMELKATRNVHTSGESYVLFKLMHCQHSNSPLFSTYHPDEYTVSHIVFPEDCADMKTCSDLVMCETCFHTHGQALILLGGGRHFSVVFTDSEQFFVEVLKCSDKNPVVKIAFPYNCAYSNLWRSSGITLGDLGWLNGISEENASGVFLAASLKDYRVLLLKWRQPD